MNIFVSGGCKNGKSMYAQKVAKKMSLEKNVPLYYVATMIPHDSEDINRIHRHINDREGWGFQTLEQGIKIGSVLTEGINSKGVFLMDSITALLSNEMFASNGEVDLDAGERVANELVSFAKLTGNSVFVSDYIYSDARNFDNLTEKYRKSLAFVDRTLAKICDRVIEVAYGNIFDYK